MPEYRTIHADDLIIDEAQSRRGDWTGDAADQRLVDSIEGIGLIHEILVRPVAAAGYEADAEYAIVAGSRRYHALLELGRTEIPCKVLDLDDETAIKTSLSENLGRKDLTDHEKARALRLWFDLLKPPAELTCERCGATHGTTDGGFLTHLREKHDLSPDEYAEACDPVQQPPYSLADTYRELSRTLHGDAGQWESIRRVVQAGTLPEDVQVLFKTDAERTAADRRLLERHGIDPDLSLAGEVNSLGVSAPMEVVTTLTQTLEAAAPHAGVASEHMLEAVGALVDPDYGHHQIRSVFRTVAKRVETLTDEGTDAVEAFELAVEEQRIQQAALDQPQVGRLQFDLEGPYQLYHERAKQRRRMEDTELVRDVYETYLEEQAAKHGWGLDE